MEFTKVEGLGNDFIVIDRRREGGGVDPRLAVSLCDRRFGIGADGVLVVSGSDSADLRMDVINNDGSQPEMCGNGLRCIVSMFASSRSGVQVETGAGVLFGERLEDGRVRTLLGRARLTHAEVDAGEAGKGRGWSVGNPHLVLRSEDDAMGRARRFGPSLVTHPSFSSGVNVGFVEPRGPASARLVVHERGAGLTMACGTGAAAAAADWFARSSGDGGTLALEVPGGALEAEVQAEGDAWKVHLVGPARTVFEGRWVQRV